MLPTGSCHLASVRSGKFALPFELRLSSVNFTLRLQGNLPNYASTFRPPGTPTFTVCNEITKFFPIFQAVFQPAVR